MSQQPKNYASEFNFGKEADVNQMRADYLRDGVGSGAEKARSLMRFMCRQDLAKLCCYVDLFRMTSGVTGSIVECGVLFGNSLMAWANLSAAFEPYNYPCKVVGFDTFSGYPNVSDKDLRGALDSGQKHVGGYFADSYEDLQRAIAIYDADRPLAQISRVELVKGDVCKTTKEYVESNPGLIVRILSLTVNLYEPTKAALEAFLPRVPKGGIVVIDALNSNMYPGTTLALLEEMGIRKTACRTSAHFPNISYIVMD